MEITELNNDELINITGGSEASDSLCYILGAICRGFYEFAKGARDGGYGYCKTGMY